MKRLISIRRNWVLVMLAALSMLHGCASHGLLIGDHQLTVDKISSERADIGEVYARKSGGGIDVVGKVKFKEAMIGTPPDHIVVTVIDPDGKVLYTTHVGYYRYGRPTKQSDSFNFSLTIPLAPPKESTLRLVNEAP